MPPEGSHKDGARQRLDKWLFFARAAKSRSLAQKLIEAGFVRVNKARTTHVDHAVAPGDVLTMTLGKRLLVWRIAGIGTRRGPPAEAATLYEDLSPSLDARAKQPPGLALPDKRG